MRIKMLRAEDCQPGTEVIAIKNFGVKLSSYPLLTIGAIYTIRQFHETRLNTTTGNLEYIQNITLNEIKQDDDGLHWSYLLEQFKLKYDPKALEIFKFKGIPVKEREDA